MDTIYFKTVTRTNSLLKQFTTHIGTGESKPIVLCLSGQCREAAHLVCAGGTAAPETNNAWPTYESQPPATHPPAYFSTLTGKMPIAWQVQSFQSSQFIPQTTRKCPLTGGQRDPISRSQILKECRLTIAFADNSVCRVQLSTGPKMLETMFDSAR